MSFREYGDHQQVDTGLMPLYHEVQVVAKFFDRLAGALQIHRFSRLFVIGPGSLAS